MSTTLNDLSQKFTQAFGAGGELRFVRAPGRVNLIGEHTDYNDGFVLPMAIEPEVRIVFRRRQDKIVRLATSTFPGKTAEFSLDRPIMRGEPSWANYSRGVAAGLVAAGVPLVGMDALFDSTLPVGGGLSSSAAMEVGTAHALLALAGAWLEPNDMARLCQTAEHEYALVPCGIMDQTIVAAAQAGHAMLLDCRTGVAKHVPLDGQKVSVVIINSMVKHELATGEYGRRRQQCEEGVRHFQKANPQIKALRDVSEAQLEAASTQLSDVVYRRCRHVIGENRRTLAFASLLEAGQYDQAGGLMLQSHQSLRDDYEVSCPELDYLVELASAVDGVIGARMTGGGFGGCIVALAKPNVADRLREEVSAAYHAKFNLNPSLFVTSAAPAAGMLRE